MSSSLFIQPGMWRVLINCMDRLEFDYHGHMLHGLHKVNAYEDRGSIIALVWECDRQQLAFAQAEALWRVAVPARVVLKPQEEFEFLRHMLAAESR